MKVLYLAHYLEDSGWANVAIENIKALDSVGIDVVCRNIPLTQKSNNRINDLLEFEQKDCHGATHCIQHVLPHHFVKTDKYKKNIGYFEYETNYISNMYWIAYLNLVDEIWCPNNELSNTLQSHGFKSKVIHHTCDYIKYLKQYPEISISELDYTYRFYTICDFNDRKNIESTIRCFYNAFEHEPVSLFIKARKFGVTEQSLCDHIDSICQKYRGINKKDYIVTKNSSSEEIMAIHQYCDCFINTSFGEAWSIPTFDAMAMGNKPIAPNYGGPKEFIKNEDHGTLVDCFPIVCDSSDSAFPDMFSRKDFWYQVNEEQVVQAMQSRYLQKNEKIRQIEFAKEFSHSKIGQVMKDFLNEC